MAAAISASVGILAQGISISFNRQASAIGATADFTLRLLGVNVTTAGRRAGSYEERLSEIMQALSNSATDAQQLLDEMGNVVQKRHQAMRTVEENLAELEAQEQTIAERIERLQALQPEAAAELANMIDSSLDRRDKQSSKRDYMIFLLGVISSAIISISATLILS